MYVYIYLYLFIYVSNADIPQKSKMFFFCIFFYSQYFRLLKVTENRCDHTVETDNYLSIYVNFTILFCMLQANVTTFLHLTTWKCVISTYTYIYVNLWYIAAQEVPFLRFHIPNFRKVL